MLPFKVSYKLYREALGRPLFYSLINAGLDEIEWRKKMKVWKKQTEIWEKMKEHGKRAKGKIVKIRLNIK